MAYLIGKHFNPTPLYFLGGVDIYDQEETLGEELDAFNIHDKDDRKELIKLYCIGHLDDLNYREKYLVWLSLKQALETENYDFTGLLKDDPDEFSSLPYGWDEIENSREFLTEIFESASASWKNELAKAEQEDRISWRHSES